MNPDIIVTLRCKPVTEELNFKHFLEEQGINPKLFWKNCKRKNQNWSFIALEDKRSLLKHSDPELWIGNAFNLRRSKYFSAYRLIKVNILWKNGVAKARKEGTPIVFGFE